MASDWLKVLIGVIALILVLAWQQHTMSQGLSAMQQTDMRIQGLEDKYQQSLILAQKTTPTAAAHKQEAVAENVSLAESDPAVFPLDSASEEAAPAVMKEAEPAVADEAAANTDEEGATGQKAVAVAEKAIAEKVAAEKVAAEEAAAEKVRASEAEARASKAEARVTEAEALAEKVAAEKVAVEEVAAAEKVAAEAAEKVAAEKVAAEEAAAKKVPWVPIQSTSQYEPDAVFLAGYPQADFAKALFPALSSTCFGPSITATVRSLLIVGRHGEGHSSKHPAADCVISVYQGPIKTKFPGRILYLDFEPFGPLPPHLKAMKNVYYLGPLEADGVREMRVVQGAATVAVPYMMMHSPTAYVASRQTRKIIGKHFLIYVQRSCQPHREKAFAAIAASQKAAGLELPHAGGNCHGGWPQTKVSLIGGRRPGSLGFLDNADKFSNYRFIISMENSAKTGYLSEKLFVAFLSGAIPIYYGSQDVFKVFNKDAFIFWDVNNPTATVRQINYLESNRAAYDAMSALPFLKDGLETINKYFIYQGTDRRDELIAMLSQFTVAEAQTAKAVGLIPVVQAAKAVGLIPVVQATMSSTNNMPASKCIDGVLMGGSNQLCHTSPNNPHPPWLQLDIGQPRAIQRVIIYNRQDCCKDRLGVHEIWLSNDTGKPTYKCFSGIAATSNGPFEEKCVGSGQYIRIVLPGTGRILNLVEVQVSDQPAQQAGASPLVSSAPSHPPPTIRLPSSAGVPKLFTKPQQLAQPLDVIERETVCAQQVFGLDQATIRQLTKHLPCGAQDMLLGTRTIQAAISRSQFPLSCDGKKFMQGRPRGAGLGSDLHMFTTDLAEAMNLGHILIVQGQTAFAGGAHCGAKGLFECRFAPITNCTGLPVVPLKSTRNAPNVVGKFMSCLLQTPVSPVAVSATVPVKGIIYGYNKNVKHTTEEALLGSPLYQYWRSQALAFLVRPNEHTKSLLSTTATQLIKAVHPLDSSFHFNNALPPRTLSVHARLGDKKTELAEILSRAQWVDLTLKMAAEGKHETVFLTTEDDDVLQLLKQRLVNGDGNFTLLTTDVKRMTKAHSVSPMAWAKQIGPDVEFINSWVAVMYAIQATSFTAQLRSNWGRLIWELRNTVGCRAKATFLDPSQPQPYLFAY